MKRTYFLRGLGIGIIVTALIMTVSDKIEDKQSRLTDNEITTKATDLGMVWPDEDKDREPEPSMPPSKSPEGSKEPSATPTSIESEQKSSQPPSSTPNNNPSKPPEVSLSPAPEDEEAKYKSISIQSGMGSESVANALEEEGLIEDASEFNEYLKQNGYASKLSVGTYQIERGATYQQIVDKITGR